MIDIALIVHIATGGLALLLGAVAMFTKKGSKQHILSGKIYGYSMMVSGLSAVYLSVVKELTFLLLIGLFSMFMVLSAWRSLAHFRARDAVKKEADILIVTIGAASSFFMIYLGVNGLLQGSMFSIVALVLGIINLMLSFGHLNNVRKKANPKKWLGSHIAGMGGAYIATFTAFLVVNVQFQPSWVIWLLPTAIGSVLISRSVRKWTAG
jgi:uncharacterized membrane protein